MLPGPLARKGGAVYLRNMAENREKLRGGREPRPDRGEPETAPGADLGLEIGCRAVLEIEGADERMASEVYGAKRDDFLIMRMPGIPGLKDKLTENRPIIARWVCGGFAYGFVSEVLGFDLRPSPLLFLEWPRTIRRVGVRGAPRLDASLPAEARGEDFSLRGRVDDISATGCQLTASPEQDVPVQKIEPGATVRLEMTLPGRESPARITARIANSAKGMRFTSLGLSFAPRDREHADLQAVLVHLKELARLTGGVTPEEVESRAPESENGEEGEGRARGGPSAPSQ